MELQHVIEYHYNRIVIATMQTNEIATSQTKLKK